MKRYSRLAIISLLLGLLGAWCVIAHSVPLLLAAIPLGLAASCTGVVALLLAGKASAPLRGRALGISVTCLGLVVTGLSLIGLLGMFLKQVYVAQQQQQAWDRARRTQEILAVNPMPDEPVTNFNSNLPIVVLDAVGLSFSKSVPSVVGAKFFDAGNRRAALSAKPDYDGLGTIHLHGSTTLHLPKRSYTFHTVDDQTNQTKVSLLGLPAENGWILYAPFEDKTLMRDVLAYELANKMGHYAPRTRYCELFLRTSRQPLSMRDYAGIYVLVEKIKPGKDRVNIEKLEPKDQSEPEITGGYIVKRDHSERNESRFNTQYGGPYFYVYPKAEKITVAQKSWLTAYFNSFEAALHGADFRNPQTGYAAYLDVDSFIDAHWLIEATKNVDGFRYSAFLIKDRGGKLKPEPPWDWNRSLGNANYYGGWQTQGWYWNMLHPNEVSWYLRLRDDPDFVQRSTDRWFRLRKDVFDPKKIAERVDELAAQLQEAQRRNFQRWPILGRQVTCNYFVGQSFQDEVDWLKTWIDRRIAWIDTQLGGPPK